MNRQKWTITCTAMAMMAITAGLLVHLKANQRLGAPGIRTSAIPNSVRRDIFLPELVLDYKSDTAQEDPNLYKDMPQDSSFAGRHYVASDGFFVNVNAVLMGTDRTTIHKPQFCLTGQGWMIDDTHSCYDTISMSRPQAYGLPVRKLICSHDFVEHGRPITYHGIYVYWFVADQQLTASHETRMWRMAVDLLKSGVLDRWAYVSFFAVCAPGQEDATYARMQKFIQAATPQFQLVPSPRSAGADVIQTAAK